MNILSAGLIGGGLGASGVGVAGYKMQKPNYIIDLIPNKNQKHILLSFPLFSSL
jgi:hypothetical protein